jgi:hypothetical protein
VDGNARLLPRLFEMYAPYVGSVTSLTPHEEFFTMATSLWQTWFNFVLVVVHNQPPIPPLSEALASIPSCPDVEAIFAVSPSLAAEHMRVYKLIRAYRSRRPAEALSAQIEADELITIFEHNLAQDVKDRERSDSASPREKRIAIGRLVRSLQEACALLTL